MSIFTHGRYPFAFSSAHPVHEAGQKRLTRQKNYHSFRGARTRGLLAKAPADKLQTAVVSFHLYPGGLWLELYSAESTQVVQAIICKADSKEKVAAQCFALPQGKSGFFWSLGKALCPEKTYVLLIRGEKHLLQRKLVASGLLASAG